MAEIHYRQLLVSSYESVIRLERIRTMEGEDANKQ